MGLLLDKPGVTCPVCDVGFSDRIHMLVNTVHYQHCEYRECVTYNELWEYLIQKEESRNSSSPNYLSLPITFDTLLKPTTRLKYEPLRFKERDDVQLFIDKTTKSTQIKFSLRCIRCKRSNRFRNKSCTFITDICNLEKTIEDIFFDIRGKKIPPCACIRKINQKSDEDTLCIFCMEENANAYFAPCQHIPYCVLCAKKCMKTYTTCPICRTTITAMVVL
jgi:hypothetical protein